MIFDLRADDMDERLPRSTCSIIGIALGLGALGSVASAAIGGSAAQSAASTEAAAAQESAQVQQNMFNTTQANLAPYMTAGSNSLSALMQLLGFTPGTTTTTPPTTQTVTMPGSGGWGAANLPTTQTITSPGATTTSPTTFNLANSSLLNAPTLAQFQQSPGYQFQLQQGLNALKNNAAATGGINSGNTLQALTQYATGLANQDWNTFYSQYTGQQAQVFNMLNALTQQGQNAAANLGGIGTTAASNIGNALTSAANASAAGTIGTASAVSGGISGLSNNALLAALLTNPSGGAAAANSGGTY